MCIRDRTGDAAGKRELLEQSFQSGFILGDIRIHLAPGAFEINIADQGRTAMTGTRDIDDVQIVLLDYPVEVDVDKVLPRGCSPMAHHQRLDVGQLQRLAKQRIVI